jgi:protein gp37
MAETTSIAWADMVFNPWEGCQKVGPGCDFCYAEARNIRFTGGANWGPGAPRRRTSLANWVKPHKWNRAALADGASPRVMCGSLCDVLDNEAPQVWRNDLWDTIRATPALRYMLITKRIGNALDMLPPSWTAQWDGTIVPNQFAHVGIIATTVTQDEIDRDAPKLFKVPAAWWGFSLEPQLGPIVLPRCVVDQARAFPGRVWIISGGESYQPQIHESRADVRGYNLKWAFSMKAQCALAGIAYFQKQLGARPFMLPTPTLPLSGTVVPYVCDRDPDAGANINDWPVPLRVQEFPAPLR